MSEDVSSLYAVVNRSKKNNQVSSSLNIYANVDKIKSEEKRDITDDHDDSAENEVNSQFSNSRDLFGFITNFKLSKYKDKSPLWIFYGLLALLALIVAVIIALAVTFTLIVKLESEITLIKGSLNFKCQRFYTLNKVSLNNFEMRIKELSANTSSKLEGLDVNSKVLSLLTHHLLYDKYIFL